MRSSSARILPAILTFVLGVALTGFDSRVRSTTPNGARVFLSETALVETVMPEHVLMPRRQRFSEGLYLGLESFEEVNPDHYWATVYLENSGPEALSYEGWGPSTPCQFELKSGAKVVWRRVCECGTGLASVRIVPGQSRHFPIHIPPGTRSFKVGMEVEVEGAAGARRQMVWSERIVVPRSE